MNLASLFSGGKDSTYSIFLAKSMGHTIKCLLTIAPRSDESHLLHHPAIAWTKLQSQSMHMPQILTCVGSEGNEIAALEQALLQARDEFGIDGLVHGGILSEFQKTTFDALCKKHDIKVLSPLWGKDPITYMNELLENRFEYIITSVSSGGLDDSWLGKRITKKDVETLGRLSIQYGFNLNFEGGEAETFVINCPLFSMPVKVRRGRIFWDNYRGRFEITEAELLSVC